MFRNINTKYPSTCCLFLLCIFNSCCVMSQSIKMAASMTGGFQIFKLQWLSYLLFGLYQTCIKHFGLESSDLIKILFLYIAFPFNISTTAHIQSAILLHNKFNVSSTTSTSQQQPRLYYCVVTNT